MSEASFASLGPTLLARKGGAKPAMRPQLAPLPELVADEQLEDLGWNDMGTDAADDSGDDSVQNNADIAANDADIVAIKPAAKRAAAIEASDAGAAAKATIAPESTLISSYAPAQEKAANAPRKATNSSRRAAFTLRLDSERHLKLRLAATLQGVSAQALVTEALDAMLNEFEDLDALALRMNGRMKRN